MSRDTLSNMDASKQDNKSQEQWEMKKMYMMKWKNENSQEQLILANYWKERNEKEELKQTSPCGSGKTQDPTKGIKRSAFDEENTNEIDHIPKKLFICGSASDDKSPEDVVQNEAKGVKRAGSDQKDEDDQIPKKMFLAESAMVNRDPIEVEKSEPKHNYPNVKNQFGDLVIMMKINQNPITAITSSCSHCNVKIENECNPSVSGLLREYKLWINNILVATSIGENRADSKAACFEKALETLQQDCYTIYIIDQEDSHKILVQLNSEKPIVSLDTMPIDKSNVSEEDILSSRMKAMMPQIVASTSFNQEGSQRSRLGAYDEGKLSDKIKKKVLDFKNSKTIDYDLVFSPDFSTAQRWNLHEMAGRLGLKSKSRGRDERRYLTMYNSFSPQCLVKMLIKRGFSSNKYVLRLPSTYKH